MKDTLLFGDKKSFAIELGFTKSTEIFKLGFWTNGRRLGSFTKGGELKYSIRTYQEFVYDKSFFYRSVFGDMSPSEIFDYLVMIFFRPAGKKLTKDDAENRKEFHLFFGDQFANQTGGFLLLYKDNKVIFIIKRPNDGPVDRFDIDFSVFISAFDEYIRFVELNNLV
ncbi:hypothetical protein [Mucilaginibacter psychrotolerans]|uniref:Uncharacterized protein n=1 Tax=Mucilaginibacter psychrotolerans TaxID=1524096 RepID=A0A4Y8SD63_9SPHI|nr:hypothetical protein [Mucilaginibacter psychrotolerans]TFF36537.1 hypothetical protein E2R66_15390 [Mucilaginibacter psychrotolerans]